MKTNQTVNFTDNTIYSECENEITNFCTDFSEYCNSNNKLPFKLISAEGDATDFYISEFNFKTDTDLIIKHKYHFRNYSSIPDTMTVTINNKTSEIISEFQNTVESSEIYYELLISTIKSLI